MKTKTKLNNSKQVAETDTFPELPEWASSSTALITEPTEAKKQIGWTTDTGTPQGIGEKPPLQYFNWWMNAAYQCLEALYTAFGNITALGSMAAQNANDVAITGGTIDGTLIGSKTLAAGSFTSLTSSTLNTGNAIITGGKLDNTPIGSVTPATAVVTTLNSTQAFDSGAAPTTNNQLANKAYVDNALSFATGMVLPFMGLVSNVPNDWIAWLDGTIGSANSGASIIANDACQALYEQIWNSFADNQCPVSGGRGDSATDDFTANKAIALPLSESRLIGNCGQGSGLSAYVPGQTLGEETVALTADNNGPHNHTVGVQGSRGQGNAGYNVGNNQGPIFTYTSSTSGSGTPHENRPPATFVPWIIKL